MPYIPQQDRVRFDTALDPLIDTIMDHGISNGELNYLFSNLALVYLSKHGTSYNTLSDVIKAFECAKLEFYAKKVRPYEDIKIAQNGDV